ncbi:MAG: BlaI/MecI/CopY family transcriptional regulator [Prevotella sp.]|nr:BlaI/MecI/CopY family transcriptional regulator [Bacteroidaceae bacterium]MBR1415436.1 BlaI/MecI/CopY family transcriptional regulator [Prevotella sp.]
MKQQTLTKSETQVMNILWDMGRGACVADVLERYAEPRPAYTTVATFLKILEQKGFVEHRKGSGKLLIYSPLLTRERYQRQVMTDVKDTLFGGSGVKLVSFFAQQEELSEEELNEIKQIINNLER